MPVKLLLVTFYLNSGLRGVSIGKQSEWMSTFGRFGFYRAMLCIRPAVCIRNEIRHYPTLAPPGGLTLHIEKLLNSSFSINLLCLKDLAHFSYIYPTKEPSLSR